MFNAVYSSRSHRRFLIRFCDTQVKRCKPLIYSGHIDTRLQMSMINCKALYNFHILKNFSSCCNCHEIRLTTFEVQSYEKTYIFYMIRYKY